MVQQYCSHAKALAAPDAVRSTRHIARRPRSVRLASCLRCEPPRSGWFSISSRRQPSPAARQRRPHMPPRYPGRGCRTSPGAWRCWPGGGGRGALLQPVVEQIGEQEQREMVEGEGALEPASGDVPGAPVPPSSLTSTSIRERLEYLLSQPPHLRLGGQVRYEQGHLSAAGCADLTSRALGAVAVPAGDREVRTHRGQAQGRSPCRCLRSHR